MVGFSANATLGLQEIMLVLSKYLTKITTCSGQHRDGTLTRTAFQTLLPQGSGDLAALNTSENIIVEENYKISAKMYFEIRFSII